MSGFGGGFDTGGGGYGGSGFGGGGASGGGYMNGGGGGGYGYGGGGGGGGGGKLRGDTLQPVTVKQIVSAGAETPDDKFVVNGQQVGLVTFIARIMSCEVGVTMITLRVDDGTGAADVGYMIEPDDTEYAKQKREHIRELAWVRVVGSLVKVDGGLQVTASFIRDVPDMNEWVYHRLEVVRAYLSQTMARPAAGGGGASGTTPVRAGMANVGLGSQGGGGVPFAGYGDGGGGLDAGGLDSGMSKQAAAVYNYLKQRHSSEDQNGVAISDIARDVPGVGGEAAVRGVMEALASDGHVYSTVDDDHFAFCMA